MKTIWRFTVLLCVFAVAAVLTWWSFRKEHGLEADDPHKERDV